jgi:FtsH-binding integral membrane protein
MNGKAIKLTIITIVLIMLIVVNIIFNCGVFMIAIGVLTIIAFLALVTWILYLFWDWLLNDNFC